MGTKRRELTYEEAVFAWMAAWAPDVRTLVPAREDESASNCEFPTNDY